MAASHVLVNHEGRWIEAELLRQYKHQGRWRCLIRYSTEPGIQYEHARWADELRRIGEA